MTFTLTVEEIDTIVALLVGLAGAIYAIYQKNKAAKTVAAFTPGTVESQTPAIVATLPERSWKMSPSTLEWCVFDATPENRKTIIDQINAAEANHETIYQVHFNGGYYIIEYGLLKGGAGNPSGK